MTRTLFAAIVLSGLATLSACNLEDPECGPVGDDPSAWNILGLGDLSARISKYGAYPISPDVEERYLIQFGIEYEKFPEVLRTQIADAGGTIRLIQGESVLDDPTFAPASSTTPNGRKLSEIPGTGGAPWISSRDPIKAAARIVVNHLYDGHGSANLVLHEQAHSLDYTYYMAGVSGSQPWHDLFKDARSVEFVENLCSHDYCRNYIEAFAETFAHYYACTPKRLKMEQQAPLIADFLKKLPTMDLRNLPRAPQTEITPLMLRHDIPRDVYPFTPIEYLH